MSIKDSLKFMINFIKKIAKRDERPTGVAYKLIENILSVPTKKFGDLLGDRVSYWQWCNRLDIVEKASEKLKRKEIPPCKLPLDFAVPFLRYCGDTEDRNLQEWWAEMLSSAIGDEQFRHVAFVGILKSLSGSDISFLDTLLNIGHVEIKGRVEAVAVASGLSPAQSRVSFNNFRRLGFFTPTGRRLTGFAFDFLRASCPHRERIDEYKDKQSKLGTSIVTD